MKYEDKKMMYYVGGGIVVIGLVAWYFYYQGKKTTTIAKLPENDNPVIIDEKGDPIQTGATTTQLTKIAADLFTDMSGYNWTGHDVKPYQDAVNLSDIDFVRLYNIFNTKYQPTSSETLAQWFYSETYIFLGNADGSVYTAFQNKLNKLNLK